MRREKHEGPSIEGPSDIVDDPCSVVQEALFARERDIRGHDQQRLPAMVEGRADGERLGNVGHAEAVHRKIERSGNRERRRREHGGAVRVDHRPAQHAPEVRLRNVKGERPVTVAIEPHDVARSWIVQAAGDRRARARQLPHGVLQLGELVLVATRPAQTLGREGDPRDRIGKALAGELDRKPALIARAQPGGDAYPVFRRSADRHEKRAERREDFTGALERSLHFQAASLSRIAARRVAQRRCHRDRVRDALKIAPQVWLRELEPERARGDVLEAVRLVDDEVFGLRE